MKIDQITKVICINSEKIKIKQEWFETSFHASEMIVMNMFDQK